MSKPARTSALRSISIIFLILIFLTSGIKAQSDINEFIRNKIDQDGRLDAGGGNFFRRYVSLKYGPLTNRKLWRENDFHAPCSTVDQTPGQPIFYGTVFNWCKDDKDIVLEVYVNAADSLGVCITGVERFDTVEVISASGNASFSESSKPPLKGNPFLSGYIGLRHVFVDQKPKPFHQLPEKIREPAEKYARHNFKPEHVKNKRRNAFGVDPGTGDMARQEGGVVFVLPSGNGPVYSGNNQRKERWLKENAGRGDGSRPIHATGSHFLVANVYRDWEIEFKHRAPSKGEIYILAWDHDFGDNAGYYKLLVRLTRSNPVSDK